LAVGIHSDDVLDDSGYSSPRSSLSSPKRLHINTALSPRDNKAGGGSPAKLSKPPSPLISIVSAAIQGHGADIFVPKPSASVEVKQVDAKSASITADAAYKPKPAPTQVSIVTATSVAPTTTHSEAVPQTTRTAAAAVVPEPMRPTQPNTQAQPSYSYAQDPSTSSSNSQPPLIPLAQQPAMNLQYPLYPTPQMQPQAPPTMPGYPYPSVQMPMTYPPPYYYPPPMYYPPPPPAYSAYPMPMHYPYPWPQAPPAQAAVEAQPPVPQVEPNPRLSASMSGRSLPQARSLNNLQSRKSNPFLSSLLNFSRSRDSLASRDSTDRLPTTSHDSVLLELLRELKEAKEDAADARYKLAEVLALVSKNQPLNDLLSSSSSTHLRPGMKKDVVTSPDRETDGDDEVIEEENEGEEYSNDFENSQSQSHNLAEATSARTLQEVPSYRSIETNTELLTPDDDLALNYDFSRPLLMSQVLYRKQLESLKQRLQGLSTDDEEIGRPLANSRSYSTTSTLLDIKSQFDRRRQENVDQFVQLLREIDPRINDQQSKSIVELYLS
jgi:hypothetical protein